MSKLIATLPENTAALGREVIRLMREAGAPDDRIPELLHGEAVFGIHARFEALTHDPYISDVVRAALAQEPQAPRQPQLYMAYIATAGKVKQIAAFHEPEIVGWMKMELAKTIREIPSEIATSRPAEGAEERIAPTTTIKELIAICDEAYAITGIALNAGYSTMPLPLI